MFAPSRVIPLGLVEPVNDEMGKRVDNGCWPDLGNLVGRRCNTAGGALSKCLYAHVVEVKQCPCCFHTLRRNWPSM